MNNLRQFSPRLIATILFIAIMIILMASTRGAEVWQSPQAFTSATLVAAVSETAAGTAP